MNTIVARHLNSVYALIGS